MRLSDWISFFMCYYYRNPPTQFARKSHLPTLNNLRFSVIVNLIKPRASFRRKIEQSLHRDYSHPAISRKTLKIIERRILLCQNGKLVYLGLTNDLNWVLLIR